MRRITITQIQTPPCAVFVAGSNNKLPLAVFDGYTRKNWSTAGWVNLNK